MKIKYILFFLLFSFISLNAGDDLAKYNYFHGSYPSTSWSGQIGGVDLPSQGTIKVLYVFVQFPDDNYQPSNSAWPKGGLPSNYNNWIDQTWSSNATPYSMTDYFNQMSLNSLHFIGKKVSVITPHARWWYKQNGKSRSYIHQEIINQLDPTWNFSEFDNWKKINVYNHQNIPDTKVDWVCFVWRNIAMEYEGRSDTTKDDMMNLLNMGWYGTTGVSSVSVDGGLRFVTSAGATVADYFFKDSFRFAIHEFAHYLLGGNDMHNGHGFWAMLSGYEVRSYMINCYERYRLGWCNLTTVSSSTQTISNATLPDFITTGIAYRIEINAATNQYFYIENHQRISRWDNCSINSPSETGLYVIRQDRANSPDGMSARWTQLVPAEGRFNWSVNQWAYPSYYPSGLPVFEKGSANRNGYHSLEYVPFTYNGNNYTPMEIIFIKDPTTGQVLEHPTRNGDGKDAFRIGFNEVFSPWSNPTSKKADGSSSGIGFKINSFTNGTYVTDIYVNTAQNAPPSRPINFQANFGGTHPILSWSANTEPDLQGYRVYKKTTLQGGSYHTTYVFTTSTTYIDNDFTIRGQGGDNGEYWLVAIDNNNNLSLGTDHYATNGTSLIQWKQSSNLEKESISYYDLYQNYPNPFNPSTLIKYALPKESNVQLTIYDIMGREIRTLISSRQDAGYKEVVWNGTDNNNQKVSSGIYIYRLRAVSTGDLRVFDKSSKLVLLK